MLHVDMNDKELQVGDRVYCPPHSYGGQDQVMQDEPIILPSGEEYLTGAVRGRIIEFVYSKGRGLWFANIQQPDGHATYKWITRCKKQAGRTQSEKETKRLADRAEKIVMATKPKPVVKKRKRISRKKG